MRRPRDALVRDVRFQSFSTSPIDRFVFGGVEIADDDELAGRAAELLRVELLDLLERHRVQARQRFLQRRHVAHVVRRVRVQIGAATPGRRGRRDRSAFS